MTEPSAVDGARLFAGHERELDAVGRQEELVALASFLEAPESLPGAFLLEGEAGIGKTTLWRLGLGLASTRSYRVLSCNPSESEAQLSFASLADLLEGVLEDVLPALPRPQGRALQVALLLEEAEGPPPDQRAIALAFLSTVRLLSKTGPVLVAVDDLQWLDGSSAFVLEFALRRLREDPVAFLLAVRREQGQDPLGLDRAVPEERLRRLVIGPLKLGALHRLLNDRLGLVLSRPKLRRLYELSGGNPFFALELGRALERGAVRLEPGESLPRTLAALVRDRLAGLPADTRAALLAAAALSQPTLELVVRAMGGDAEKRLAPALSANVLELEENRIRFSHPLLASGIYAATRDAERRALHRRLADLVTDPEERARHLALGTEGPDPAVATSLEEAARYAHSRGALRAAADLSDQARRLTPPDREDERHGRAIQAAGYAFLAGESGRTWALLEEALDTTPAGPRRAEVLVGLARLQEYEGDRRVAVELFRRALAEVGDDLPLRVECEYGIADSLYLMRTDLAAAAKHARAAVALAERTGDKAAGVPSLGVQGLIDAVTGRAQWRAALERGVRLEREAEPVRLVASASYCLGYVLTCVDEFDRARTISRSLRLRAEERAEDSALPWILALSSLVDFLAGRWGDALRWADEGYEVALQTGQEPQRLYALGVRALVRACRGEVEGARADADAVLEPAQERGVMIATILASSALGLLELSLGRPDAVHRLLGPLGQRLEQGGVREPGSARFLPDDIEALIGLGRLDEAEQLLDRLESRARRLDRASALAAAGRCRGLLAAGRGDLDRALAFFEGAVSEHERVPIPFDQARTLLTLGTTRRRARMKRPAREALEQALATFEELGARLWAEKARAELARIGGRPPATGDLTPTEQRIAEYAAEGRTNKEIAAVLFLTPKTVDTQLSRIYRKVSVRSRTELAGRLKSDGETGKV